MTFIQLSDTLLLFGFNVNIDSTKICLVDGVGEFGLGARVARILNHAIDTRES